MSKRSTVCGLSLTFVASLWSVPAGAALIDFEDGIDDASVGTFYSSQGIEFSNTSWENIGNLPGMSGTFCITNTSGAQYEPKLPNQLIAVFPGLAASTVAIDAINYGIDGVRIDAYDALVGGTLVDFDSAVTADTNQFITLSVNAASIRRIEIYQDQPVPSSGDGIVFDDLEFTLVPEPTALGLLGLAAAALSRNRKR